MRDKIKAINVDKLLLPIEVFDAAQDDGVAVEAFLLPCVRKFLQMCLEGWKKDALAESITPPPQPPPLPPPRCVVNTMAAVLAVSMPIHFLQIPTIHWMEGIFSTHFFMIMKITNLVCANHFNLASELAEWKAV